MCTFLLLPTLPGKTGRGFLSKCARGLRIKLEEALKVKTRGTCLLNEGAELSGELI